MPDCTNIENQISEKQNQIDTLEEFCPLLPGGRERAQCFAQLRTRREELRRLEEALRSCQAGLPAAGIQQTQGRVIFLRVSELGDAFGPREDSIKAEVVFKLDTQPGRAFGFRLEDNENRPVREGMLSSLRESLINKLNVVIDYDQKTGKFNSITKRVALKGSEGSTVVFPVFSAET